MIYIHVPFCKSFCVYCAFYSELCPADGASRQELFVKSLLDEIRLRRSEIERNPGPDTLYIGGGTPSVLPPGLLRTIVRALPPGVGRDEFTIEVNPDDIVSRGEEYIRELRGLGVNRVSMGVQSFDDGILRWMRRRHDASAAIRAMGMLRRCGVQNISLDLIFGIAGLSTQTLRDTLSKALELRPEHISAYQLSLDEDSDLDVMVQKGQYSPMDDETCREQYGLICETLAQAGYRHYEISNWALPGREAVHNSAYWRRVPYVGLGAGAHSFDGTRRRWNSAMTPDGNWSPAEEVLTEEDVRVETIMLGLRTADGLDAAWLEAATDAGILAELRRRGALVPVDGQTCSEGAVLQRCGPPAPANPPRDGAPMPGKPPVPAADAVFRPPLRFRIPEDHFFVSDDIISSII